MFRFRATVFIAGILPDCGDTAGEHLSRPGITVQKHGCLNLRTRHKIKQQI